jgi:hypothetical protein
VVAAYRNKSDRHHQSVKTFSDLVSHYAYDHPETSSGEPAPWPEPVPTGREKTDADPFADLQPDEAAAMLLWAKTRPEYDAYFDKAHPQHADYVEQTSQLMAIAHPDQGGDAGDGGLGHGAPSSASVDQAAIDALRKDPAYLDRHHPDHRAAVDAVTKVYQGSPSPVAAAESHGDIARRRIRELEADPAYRDRHHAEHADRVAQMTTAYQQAYPEPSPGDQV